MRIYAKMTRIKKTFLKKRSLTRSCTIHSLCHSITLIYLHFWFFELGNQGIPALKRIPRVNDHQTSSTRDYLGQAAEQHTDIHPPFPAGKIIQKPKIGSCSDSEYHTVKAWKKPECQDFRWCVRLARSVDIWERRIRKRKVSTVFSEKSDVVLWQQKRHMCKIWSGSFWRLSRGRSI